MDGRICAGRALQPPVIMSFRIWRVTVLKMLWGGFLLLTSLYCLLAFLPYTYSALIKAPPYDWIPWFVGHHAALYWLALLASTFANWPIYKGTSKLFLFAAQAGVGIYLSVHPVLGSLHSDWTAYVSGLVALALLIPVAALDTFHSLAGERSAGAGLLLNYSTGITVAVAVALLWAAGAQLRLYDETGSLRLGGNTLELAGWS